MIIPHLSLTTRWLSLSSLSYLPRTRLITRCMSYKMGHDKKLLSSSTKRVAFRLCRVSSYETEVLEIKADNPVLHVLFIPGNPGVVTFYKEFVESLYEMLGGDVSVTAVGHIGFTKKNWKNGRLFSLQEQIDHKVDFISQELQNIGVPTILVGHSIGSYIAIDIFKRFPENVIYCIGLYPFLTLNQQSKQQSTIEKLTKSPRLCAALSFTASLFGLLPETASRFIVAKTLGRSWSACAIDATCTHLLQYHSVRNMLFMAMTEFQKLLETPDWTFMRGKEGKMSFLFGIDDHWGPLQMFEDISKQVPGIDLFVEREGHTHSFCCTEAGSMWVARHVASLTKNIALSLSQ